MGKGNSPPRQESLIHVIHPRRTRTHKAGLSLPQECPVDAGLAAQQKHVRRLSLRGGHGAPGNAREGAELRKETLRLGQVLIHKQLHDGRNPWATLERIAYQPTGMKGLF